MLLQFADLLAQRRLRAGQHAGSPVDAAGAQHRHESTQQTGIEVCGHNVDLYLIQ
ncbi:hypothetical protein D3C85_1663450 [compost metagenome]